MTHYNIYIVFEAMFPAYAGDNAETWFPNGRNSIRVRLKNKAEFIFTYHSKNEWVFETVDHFLNNIKEK